MSDQPICDDTDYGNILACLNEAAMLACLNEAAEKTPDSFGDILTDLNEEAMEETEES